MTKEQLAKGKELLDQITLAEKARTHLSLAGAEAAYVREGANSDDPNILPAFLQAEAKQALIQSLDAKIDDLQAGFDAL